MEPEQNTLASESTDQNNTAVSAIDAIRKRAISAFVPLAGELDGDPQQRFELLMSAVRVTHSPAVLAKALDAAEHIEQKNARAEALIDVINEANYQADYA
jgi:hypothetical protein